MMSDTTPDKPPIPPAHPDAVQPPELAFIRGRIRGLAHDDPVRALAEAVIDRRTPPDGAVEAALGAMSDRRYGRWNRRIASIWSLGRTAHDPSATDRVAAALAHIVDQRQFKLSGRWMMPGVCCSGTALLFLPFVVYLMAADGRLNKLRAVAAGSLGRLRTTTGMGAIARAIGDVNRPGCAGVRQEAGAALTAMLSRLTPAHYGWLDPDVVPELCSLLSNREAETVLLLLDGLHLAGDGRAVGPVQRLIKSGRTLEVRLKASAALPVLEARKRLEESAMTLVRPAMPPDAPEAILLRPVQAGAAPDTSTLVRPSSVEAALELQEKTTETAKAEPQEELRNEGRVHNG